MRIGTGPFIGVLVAVAFAALGTGLLLESRPLLWSSVVIGAYALHLLANQIAVQGAGADSSLSERPSLDSEREEIERLKRELERKLVQAEEQWTLLRSMVQERLKRSGGSKPGPSVPDFESQSSPGGSGGRATGAKPGSDDSSRVYGRW